MPTFHGKVLPFNYDSVARRRKYIIGLAAILGSLVASALAVGIVEALRARSMRRVVNTQPLDAGVSGEGSRPWLSVAASLAHHICNLRISNITQCTGCIKQFMHALCPGWLGPEREVSCYHLPDDLMLHAGSSISKGYVLPVNKQGIHDQRYYDAVSTALDSFASILCLTHLGSCWHEGIQIMPTPQPTRHNKACCCVAWHSGIYCPRNGRATVPGIHGGCSARRAALQCVLAALRELWRPAFKAAHVLPIWLPTGKTIQSF